MSHLTSVCFVVFTVLIALHISGIHCGGDHDPIIVPEGPPTQGNRLFGDICEGCIVSKGYGFVTDPDDCNCFYQCKYVRSFKLSSMASDWVSTKMCCACGESWSMKTLTCVRFRDKRSDCFKTGSMAPDNVCDGVSDGVLIPRRSPNSAAGDYMCAGFVRCTAVDQMGPAGAVRVMPYADCCEPGDCFSGTIGGMCSAAACNVNAACDPHDAPDDCQKPTVAPETECLYMSVPDTDTQFMAKETMDRFDCAQGTCWDDDLCACVATNNTGYNDCDRPFFNMDFDGDMLNSGDGRGNTIWAEATSGITFTGGSAIFDGSEEYINIGGLAASYIGSTFVAHFEMTFQDNDGTFTAGQSECIFGNCLQSAQSTASDTDTIRISVQKDGSGIPTDILASVTYQDTAFMLGNSMATVDLQASGPFALNTNYEIWLIVCGKTEEVALGVLDNTSEVLVGTQDIDDVPDVKSVIMGQSGFVFGKCPSADNSLEATINEVEFWKYCKPFGDSEFQTAYDEIFIN